MKDIIYNILSVGVYLAVAGVAAFLFFAVLWLCAAAGLTM